MLKFKIISPANSKGYNDPVKEAGNYLPKLFLAGPCPRKNYENDWRNDAYRYLERAGFIGIVFSPTNSYFKRDLPGELERQVSWEVAALEAADKVLFWIPRDKENPAFTTNIEIGTYLSKERINKIIVGMPDSAEKVDYIKIRLQMLGKKWYNNLEDEINDVVKELNHDR